MNDKPFPTADRNAPFDLRNQSWRSILADIRKRPVVYLGSPNLHALHMLKVGVSLAELLYDISRPRRQEADDVPWQDFESYVEDLHNKRRLSLNSFGLAQYKAQGENLSIFDTCVEYSGAWDIWWRWYDDFACAKGTSSTVSA
jgi:hypothetical protein